jgi:hypothetical protein
MTTTTSTSFEPTRPGITCRGCNRRLPLRNSDADERAALWECVSCNTPFAGVLLTDALDTVVQRVRLAEVHFETDEARLISHELRQFVRQFEAARLNSVERFVEKRRSARVAQDLDVVAVGVDADCRLVGNPLHAMVANLSAHGMLLVSEVALECEMVFVRVPLKGEWLQLFGRIAWSRELGSGYFGIGVEFVARLGDAIIR